MPNVSSVSGANQYGWQQLKLQMAQRNADQAEQMARALREKANQAQQVADQAKEEARSLAVQASQADTAAGQARHGVAEIKARQQTVSQLSSTVDQVLGWLQAGASIPVTTMTIANPYTAGNTPEQGKGTIINTTA